ncbi:MAG: PepSY-associated TM helix domain-containing protein, partial [Actinomycetota bacterium]
MSITGKKLDGGVELRLPDTGDPPPDQPVASPEAVAPARASAGVYRAVWRWHFYAAAFVIPVLVTLAVSGALYLFRPQIEPMVYGDLMRHPLPAAGARPLPLGEQVAAVEAAVGGQTVSRIVTPVEPGRTTQVYTRDTTQTYTDSEGTTSGLERVAFVNPYTGQMLGQLVVEDMFMEDLRDFHGELMAGRIGDRIVEISSSWALILVGTGFYLWWRCREPRQRQRRSGVARSGRPKIRNRHAAVGALSGLLIVFFVVSGLPWSGYWGSGFQKLSLAAGLDEPELAGEATTSNPAPMLTRDLAGGSNGADWATELLPVPASEPAGHAGHAG